MSRKNHFDISRCFTIILLLVAIFSMYGAMKNAPTLAAASGSTSHSHTAKRYYKAPTCTEAGYEYEECTICGKRQGERTIPAYGHSLVSHYKSPTCLEPGYDYEECTRCGIKHGMTSTPPLGHKFETVNNPAPTCEKSGARVTRCSVCKLQSNLEFLPATGHKPGNWEVVQSGTCQQDSIQIQKCMVCGKEVTRKNLGKKSHTDTNKDGKCDWCGTKMASGTTPTPTGVETRRDYIDAGDTGHEVVAYYTGGGKKSLGIEAHVYQSGVCSLCAHKLAGNPCAKGHDWGEWKVTKAATTTSTGVRTRICKRNSLHTETEVIPKITGGTPFQKPSASPSPSPVIPVDGYVKLNKSSNTIVYGTASDSFTISSSHGGALSVKASSGSASISGTKVTVSGLGKLAVGTKVTVTVTCAGNANYNQAIAKYTITIAKRDLTVTANNLSKKQGAANPALTYKVGATVNSEVAAFNGALSTKATATSAKGTYDILQGNLALKDNGSFKASNYNLKFTKGTLTVTAADGNGFIELEETSASIPYGTPDNSVTVKGNHGGAITATTTKGTVTVKDNVIKVSGLGNLPAGTKVVVTIKCAATKDNKEVVITYNITITKRTLNVTIANKTKKQGEANPKLEYTYKGAVNNEVPAFIGGIKTDALDNSPVGKYDIVSDGLALKDNGAFLASNYNLKIKEGTLTITKGDDKADTQAPRGNDSEEYTDQDKPVKSVIDGSDDVGIVKVVVTTQPQHGKVVVKNDRSYTYTPEEGYYGDDYFISMLEDAAGNRSNPIKVTIHIRKKLEETDIIKNKEKDIVIEVNETYITKNFPGVDKNDDKLTYEITAKPKKGTLDLISGPALKYVPQKDYVGKDNFTIKVTNGKETINIKFNVRIEEKETDKEYTWYIRGYEDGTVRPDGTITREELATIFYRIDTNSQGGKYKVKKSYSDVAKDRWSYDAIMYLSDKGIINGYADGTFRPQNPVNRAELAAVIARYAQLKSKTSMLYNDIDSDFWANDVISKVTERGLMNGYGDGSFMPEKALTRAEVATVINRLLERNIEDASVNDNPFSDLSTGHWAYKNMVEAFTSHVVRENGNQRGRWMSHSYPYLNRR